MSATEHVIHARTSPETEACLICQPIIAAIEAAEDAHQLHYLFGKLMRPTITEAQRADLKLRINLKFSALNCAAKPQPKAR
jgi:hypothetical protein